MFHCIRIIRDSYIFYFVKATKIFVTSAYTRTRLPEDDEDTLKHIGALTLYKILFIYIYIYIYIAFVCLDNKLYMMNGTYIKTLKKADEECFNSTTVY